MKTKTRRATTRRNKLDARPLDDAEVTSSERLAEVLAALGEPVDGIQHEIRIYFVEANNAKSYLFTATPEQAAGLPDYLRDNCGPGTFRGYVRKIGDGSNEIAARFTIRVRTIASLQQARLPALAPSPQASPQVDQLTRILENQSRLLESIAARLATPPVDPVAQMETFARMLEALKSVAAPPAPAAPQYDPFELIERGIELAQDYGGGGGGAGDEGLTGIVRTLIPIARDYLERMNGTPQASTPSSVEAPRPNLGAPSRRSAPPTPAARAAPARSDAAVELVRKIRDQLQFFAIQGTDVRDAAAWCWQNIPENLLQSLAADDATLGALEQEFPELVAQHGYLAALRVELRRDIRADAFDNVAADDDDSDSLGPGGSEGDA